MIIKYPDYYKKFKCIAGECIDTCCAGWQVVVDENTAEFYNNVINSFGDKLREKMKVDNEGDIVFENENGRCPFLNNCNLCEIYINLGEENLSHTCTMFPRFSHTFGGTREMGLSLSCPVANHLILTDNKLAFKSDFTDEMPEINDLDADLYISLKEEREKLFQYIKSDLPLDRKLKAIYSYSFKLKDFLEVGDYDKIKNLDFIEENIDLEVDYNIFQGLEYLTEKGSNYLKGELLYTHNYSKEYINILHYFIYRYFLKSIYDENTFEALLFSIFSVKTISAIENTYKIPLSGASRLFSKEIEHSENNLNLIFDTLK